MRDKYLTILFSFVQKRHHLILEKAPPREIIQKRWTLPYGIAQRVASVMNYVSTFEN